MIRQASSERDYSDARILIEEYVVSLGFDLHFQDFEREMSSFPGPYAPPRGCILLADVDGVPVGCVAVRPFSDSVCEMKRLYVRPSSRGQGVGRALAQAGIEAGRAAGYRQMRLDTLSSMVAANRLYGALGFREIDAYRHNPMEGARYFELDLRSGCQQSD